MGNCLRLALLLPLVVSQIPVVVAEEFEEFDLGTDSVLQAIDLSAYGIANFDVDKWGAGIGGQFAYPLLREGLLPSSRFRDDLHLESGLDLLYWDWDRIESGARYDWSAFAAVPHTGVRWRVYVVESIAVFATVKIGLSFAFMSGDQVDQEQEVDFYWSGTLGAIWDVWSQVSLRIELLGYSRFADAVRLGALFRF